MDTLKRRRAKSLDMTQGSPIRLLVLFAIPMLIGSVFQQMYNMTDTVVVGRFVSVEALGRHWGHGLHHLPADDAGPGPDQRRLGGNRPGGGRRPPCWTRPWP